MIRLCIVDDHPVFRSGLRELLELDGRFEIVSECSGAGEAIEAIDEREPDIAVVDLSLPCMNGLELTGYLGSHHPRVSVLILSMHEERPFAERAMRAGAKGYVCKREAGRTVVEALESIARGESYFMGSPEDSSSSILRYDSSKYCPNEALDRLSDRELTVFFRIGQGMGNDEISRQLNISRRTVETHVRKMLVKLNMDTTPELRKYAVRWFLVNLPA